MAAKDEEHQRLRSVTLQNSRSIDLAQGTAEEALRKQSEWLRVTLASIGDAVISTDVEGRVTFMNGVAEALTGWFQAEAAGRPLPDIFHIVNERTRQPVANPALRALQEGTVVGLANQTVLIARDGAERPIDDSAAPMRDESDSPIGAVLVFRDVADRKLADEAQRRLAAIVESSDDAIVSKTIDGVIRSWNAGAERIFGYTAKQAVGESITIIIPPDRLDEERLILERLRRGERIDHFETVRMARGGRLLDISLTVSPIRDDEGNVIGASKIARDITAQKQAERERRRLQRKVEAERARLHEADRKKDEFLAILAHELRNPLAPLRNGLHLMRLAEGDAGAIAQTRDMMERQLGHMVRLIDDLLDISRISQNKMELRRSRVLLADVVSSAVETARPAIEAMGHQLTLSLPSAPIHLDADLTRLAQVFSNLLSNSAKYTPHGGEIWLTAEQRGARAVISVRDSGIGIPPESLPRIFEMFSQIDRSIERSSGGLGIGLALVKGLVEMHAGTIAAESEGEGKGSAFTVTLPALAEHADRPASSAPAVPAIAAGARRRVLVVDDNRDSAESMAMLLRLAGNEAVTVHDGLTAVEAAAEFRPNVILMDIGMPGLNGHDATRRIREQAHEPRPIIIALTGWGQEGDRKLSRAAGCDGHLVKPVRLSDLEKLLSELKNAGLPQSP